jgi:hypothetical protein
MTFFFKPYFTLVVKVVFSLPITLKKLSELPSDQSDLIQGIVFDEWNDGAHQVLSIPSPPSPKFGVDDWRYPMQTNPNERIPRGEENVRAAL